MNNAHRLLLDATMLLRWQHLAPVGIVRLERILASHLRFRSGLGSAEYVVWDRGYRPADANEVAALDALLAVDPSTMHPTDGSAPNGGGITSTNLPTPAPNSSLASATRSIRRVGLRALGQVPDSLRPFASQAAWSLATLGIETRRHVKRSRSERRSGARPVSGTGTRHRVHFDDSTDLVALGLGWEYLDHLEMYRLKSHFGVRIHMPAFDLIPVAMPQMNSGQSHLVHRYYAEMAHYADSITCISHATRDAVVAFFDSESLPTPHLAVNQLPGIGAVDLDQVSTRRHRLGDTQFVMSVSTIEIRKNHILLAKIWAECIKEGRTMPKLVLVGRFGWDVDELKRWVDHAPELADSMVIYTDVEDDELVAMYADAEFTLLPSRIEGWGLPITESLAYGKVCVHSADPAQIEAAQGLMPTLHPDDFLGWKSEILRLVGDADYRGMLEDRIRHEFVERTPTTYAMDYERIIQGRRDEAPRS